MNQKLKNEELGRLTAEEFRSSEKHPLVVVLDNIRSLNNVGSVFRTCDAFLIDELILCGVTGTPPNKEIEKTALGATATVKWSYRDTTLNALTELKNNGYTLIAVEQAVNSVSLKDHKWNNAKTALVFGNEVYGVEQDVVNACDTVLEIPQAGTKHSLNISVSAGIVLWEFVKEKL
jgi:tRNA G18 (ribose-2'-O)-methylase SpoU